MQSGDRKTQYAHLFAVKGSSRKAGAPYNLVGAPSAKKLSAVKAGKCKSSPSVTWVPPKTGTKRYVEAFFNKTAGSPPATVEELADVALLLLNRGSAKPVISAIDLHILVPVVEYDNETDVLGTPTGRFEPTAMLAPMYRADTGPKPVPAPPCPGYSRWPVVLHGSAPIAPWWPYAGVFGVRVTVGEGGSGTAGLPGLAAVGLVMLADRR
ncbi:hypothetical protein GPECTOR_18g28 [Gonium pectorale]|uniref:Uncharacterized protein n=1 Tax=Gonium pectorale TaxID=33097 RepID=A0A150GJV5_GONPE|nr:hypothetical protein GPECTOR_18g28 [Gonium pectorale]|eukprot:KXZ50047.1 hypothetical protein GPECTOR_18g28 [Gonium pectorale]